GTVGGGSFVTGVPLSSDSTAGSCSGYGNEGSGRSGAEGGCVARFTGAVEQETTNSARIVSVIETGKARSPTY
ncbi:MAG: hypothetical protein ACOCYQ_06330, partial [Alkalispirochaeta sp.]